MAYRRKGSGDESDLQRRTMWGSYQGRHVVTPGRSVGEHALICSLLFCRLRDTGQIPRDIMATPFNPPSTQGKPAVPQWDPPEPTSMDLDWASLHTIDLSLLDSPDTKVVENLVQLTKTAIKEDGFLYLTNYGVSLDQLQRQFDLAEYLHRNISDEDKERLLWNPKSGVFAGFKRRLGWQREAGDFDGIEQFNFYRGEFADPDAKVPDCIKPFMDEIAAFSEVSCHEVCRNASC